MKRIAALFVLMQILLIGSPALAQGPELHNGSARLVSQESWVEEWDAQSGTWVRVAAGSDAAMEAAPVTTITTTYLNGEVVSHTETAGPAATPSVLPDARRAATRYARPLVRSGPAAMLAQYGPFIVTSETSAAMIGSTDRASPAHFDAMLRDFPGLAMLEMVEAPGTSNDLANLAVARRIRAAGIATHVPAHGSVRSGAVELFLAGASRTMEDGAQFAVHSWLDNYGREAADFAEDHPANRLYLDFYVEMGMSESRARAFYAMTNSVPHASALWLGASDMRGWLREEPAPFTEQPALQVAELPEAKVPVEAPVLALDYSVLSGISLAQLDAFAI